MGAMMMLSVLRSVLTAQCAVPGQMESMSVRHAVSTMILGRLNLEMTAEIRPNARHQVVANSALIRRTTNKTSSSQTIR